MEGCRTVTRFANHSIVMPPHDVTNPHSYLCVGSRRWEGPFRPRSARLWRVSPVASASPTPVCPRPPVLPQVNLVSEHIWCEDFLVRSFYLKNLQTNETRTVTQFHFLSWYDQGVPSSTRSLLDFRR